MWAKPVLVALGTLLMTASGVDADSSVVRTRVSPGKALAGERLTVSSRVRPVAGRCSATVTVPGARPAHLRRKAPIRGKVTWRWSVPVKARGGIARARVTCPKAGSGTARLVVRSLPSGNPDAGKTVYLLNCGGCHTLRDADTQGTSVDLDAARPTYETTVDRVVNGKALMPSFKSRLTPQQIADVATYVSSAAGR